MNKNRAENDQLLKELHERLEKYTENASEENFDEKEVEAIVQLIDVLERADEEESELPDYNEFMRYMERRDAADASMEIGGQHIPKAAHGSIKRGVHVRFFKHNVAVAAAAVLAVVVLAGSTIGVANANKSMGFFNWLKKDESGEVLVISPEGSGTEDKSNPAVRYNTEEEVPEEYQQYLIGIEEYESLQGYELEYVEILKLLNCTKTLYHLTNEQSKKVDIGRMDYDDKDMLKQENYKGYEHIENQKVKGIQIFIYSKVREDKTIDYLARFYYGNSQYFIMVYNQSEKIKEISTEYVNKIIN